MALKLAADELRSLKRLGKPVLTPSGMLKRTKKNAWAYALIQEWRDAEVAAIRADTTKEG